MILLTVSANQTDRMFIHRSFFSISAIFISLVSQPVLSQSSETEEAVDIQINSQSELASRQRAEVLNNRGYERLVAEQYADAELLFRQAIALDSSSQLYYENLARSLGQQQKIEQVVAVYQRAQRQFPRVSDLYYYRADALQKLKRYEAAREDYTRAIALADENPDTQLRHLYYFNRGNTYLKEQRYAEAQQDYDQALQINEHHYGTYANRGFARYNLKNLKGACDDWRKAQEAGYETAQRYITKYCQ